MVKSKKQHNEKRGQRQGHDLRRTFIPTSRKQVFRKSLIMEITGYSNREMLDRYNTNDNENRKEAAGRLEGFLTIEAANIEKTLTNDGALCENNGHAVSGNI